MTSKTITDGTDKHFALWFDPCDVEVAASDEDEGGGGGTPEPEELFFADFANGVYRAGGVGVTLADIFIADEAYGASFDPAAVVPGTGLVSTNDVSAAYPAFTGAALAALLAGSTLVINGFATDSGTRRTPSLEAYTTDFVVDNIIGPNGSDHLALQTNATAVAGSANPNGAVRIAATLSATGVQAASINGSSVITNADVTDPATGVVLYAGSPAGCYVTSITVYPRQLDADLPALSALV